LIGDADHVGALGALGGEADPLYSLTPADVIVDINGWFLESARRALTEANADSGCRNSTGASRFG